MKNIVMNLKMNDFLSAIMKVAVITMVAMICAGKIHAQSTPNVASMRFQHTRAIDSATCANFPSTDGCWTYNITASGFNVNAIYADSIASSNVRVQVPLSTSIWTFYHFPSNSKNAQYAANVISIERNIGWISDGNAFFKYYMYTTPDGSLFPIEISLINPSDTSKYDGLYYFITK